MLKPFPFFQVLFSHEPILRHNRVIIFKRKMIVHLPESADAISIMRAWWNHRLKKEFQDASATG